MSDQGIAARGERAARELAETTEAFEALKRAMIEELIATPVGQTLKIERLHMGLQQLDGVRKALVQVVNHGAIARQALAVETGLFRPG